MRSSTRTIRIGVNVLRGIPRLLSDHQDWATKAQDDPKELPIQKILIHKPYFIPHREFGPLREGRQVFGNIPCCSVASQVAYHESQENEYLRRWFKVSARTKFQRVQLQAGNPTTPNA